MKCDKCDKPAVVHEVTIKNGKKAEIHLCDEHAAEAGFVVHQSSPTINQVLKQFVISSGASGGRPAGKACPECGMTFAEFRKGGTLGCPACYEAFEDEVGPLIERAHNGGTHHVGRTPRNTGAALNRHLEVRRLMKELDVAIAAEEYERAAEIRDRLNEIEPPEEPDDGPHAAPDRGGKDPTSTTSPHGDRGMTP